MDIDDIAWFQIWGDPSLLTRFPIGENLNNFSNTLKEMGHVFNLGAFHNLIQVFKNLGLANEPLSMWKFHSAFNTTNPALALLSFVPPEKWPSTGLSTVTRFDMSVRIKKLTPIVDFLIEHNKIEAIVLLLSDIDIDNFNNTVEFSTILLKLFHLILNYRTASLAQNTPLVDLVIVFMRNETDPTFQREFVKKIAELQAYTNVDYQIVFNI